MAAPAAPERRSSITEMQYIEGRDSPSEVSNVLLIVAALIAAATFQAGVNPPGGVWQDNEDEHTAGKSVYASAGQGQYYAFLITNTVALSCAIQVIFYLVHNYPFYLEIWVALTCMIATYSSSVQAVTPEEYISLAWILGFAAIVPFILRGLNQCRKKIC